MTGKNHIFDKNTEEIKSELLITTDSPDKKKSKLNFQNPLVSMSFSAFVVASAFFAYQHIFATSAAPPMMEVMESNVQMA